MFVAVLFSVPLVLCYPVARRAAPPQPDCETILKSLSDLKGFQFREVLSVYLPENLHLYIDGAADFYLRHGFVKLATSLMVSEMSGGEITVEIYQMESASQADFIYEAEKGSLPDNLEVGQRGYRTEGFVEFVKGVFMVKLLAFGPKEGERDNLMILSRFIDEKIPPQSNLR